MKWKLAALVAIFVLALRDNATPTGTPTVVHRISSFGGGGSHPNPDKPRILLKKPGSTANPIGKSSGSPP